MHGYLENVVVERSEDNNGDIIRGMDDRSNMSAMPMWELYSTRNTERATVWGDNISFLDIDD